MTERNKLLLTAFVFTVFTAVLLPAQDEGNVEEAPQKVDLYTLGDQDFSISAGLVFPLFFLDLTPASGSSAVASTNLTLGGTGSLLYEAYLTNHFKLGLELGGMFAYSPNKNPFFMVPITARVAYEFHFGQFSMPLFMGMGVNILSYDQNSVAQFIMKPGVSLYWHYNSDWSFGGNLVWWICPEIVPDVEEENRIGNFLDFTISARYHF